MRLALKGSPVWSIDENGFVSISTKWMCYRDEDTNVLMGWLDFQSEVEKFVGKSGDAYKMPKSTGDGREITAYEESTAFIVQSAEYTAVDGRTSYEVSFTCGQNLEVMTLFSDIGVQINENNERIKSAVYKVSTVTNPIDHFLLTSGTVAEWAGGEYLIESSDYAADSKYQYTINITAKDMSKMMIGLPNIVTDSHGEQTISTVWRFSKDAYSEAVLPKQGEDASAWIGNRNGFVIQSVNSAPQGVLGYYVTITAVSHTTARRISSTRTVHEDYTEWESRFKANSPKAIISGARVGGTAPSALLPDGSGGYDGTVREISYNEYITGKYEVIIKMSNKDDKDKEPLESTWDVRISEGSMELPLEQTGWAKSESGTLYRINFPPATKFTYVLSPNSIIEMMTSNGAMTPQYAESELLNAIKYKGSIGFDIVAGVQAFDSNETLSWLSDVKRNALQDLNLVQSVMLEGYVHAQPNMTVGGRSIRNLLFTPWNPDASCPLRFNWEYKNNRCIGVPKSQLRYKYRYHDITVTKRYRLNIKQALLRDNTVYYNNAIKLVSNINYTAYKGAGITYNAIAVRNDDGQLVDYTEVACTIKALLASNKGQPKWNGKYDNTPTSK